jgi:hypothetical protein
MPPSCDEVTRPVELAVVLGISEDEMVARLSGTRNVKEN